MVQHENTSEVILKAADYGAIGVAVTTLVGWLPHVAALLSIIWLAFRILTQRAELKLRELELKNLQKESQ
jgi:hypothetical protein